MKICESASFLNSCGVQISTQPRQEGTLQLAPQWQREAPAKRMQEQTLQPASVTHAQQHTNVSVVAARRLPLPNIGVIYKPC